MRVKGGGNNKRWLERSERWGENGGTGQRTNHE